MGFFRTVILVSLLVCGGSSSTTAALKMTAPTYAQRYAENYQGVVHKRLLRVYESTKDVVEDRANLGSFTTMLKDSATLQRWLFNKKSGIDVLNAMHVGNNIENTLKSAELEMLVKYVNKFNKGKLPDERISVVGSLMQKYGDDVVLTAIARADQVGDTKTIASKLEADVVLNYVALLKGKVPDQKTMVKKLADDFGGDDKILSMIRVANTGSLSKNKVKELKELETKVLVQHIDGLMTSRNMDNKLETVLNHLSFLNTKVTLMNPNFPDTAFLRILTAKYGERAVAKGLPNAIATTKGSTQSFAVKLQMQQLNSWKSEKKSINDVFKLLNFDQYVGIAVVTSPGLDALHSYIKLFYTKQPALKLYIKMLSSRFDGEDKLALFLQTALNDGTTGPLVGKLQKDLFQKWKNDGLYHDSLIKKVFHVNSGPPTPAVSRIAKEYNTFVTPFKARNNEVKAPLA